MSRNNGLIAFLGGLGTGYLQGEKEKKDRDRQAKMDQIALDDAARKKEEYEANKAMDEKVKALPTSTYGDKRAMSTDDVRAMMGGSTNEADANYVSEEAAMHYLDNNTGVGQVQANAASIAQQGVGTGLNGMKAIAGADGGVQIADPASEKAIPLWKRLEQEGSMRISSGDSKQAALGFQALQNAQLVKAKEMKEGMTKANATGGAVGLMEYMSNWDNEDFPVTGIRLEGNKVFGTVEGKEKMIRELQIPEGMTADDALYTEAMGLVDPDKMLQNKVRNLGLLREDKNRAEDVKFRDTTQAEVIKQNGIHNAQTDRAFEETKKNNDASRRIAAGNLTINQLELGIKQAEAGTGKPLTTEQRTKSAEIQAARMAVNGADKDGKAFLKSGDNGMNAQVPPEKQLLAAQQKLASEADPALVKIYGSDPFLDRHAAKGKPYRYTPLIPNPAAREIGTVYELPDGKAGKWDGKGLVPVK